MHYNLSLVSALQSQYKGRDVSSHPSQWFSCWHQEQHPAVQKCWTSPPWGSRGIQLI